MSFNTAKRRTELDLLRHIWKNVSRTEAGCWEWNLSRDTHGYGQIGTRELNEKSPIKAHRATWILFYGDVPAGMHLHHKCGNQCCCNPDHLELLTPREHLNQHFDPDYCVRGHAFTPENTAYKVKKGFRCRICKKCDAERVARRRKYQMDKYAAPCVWCGGTANINPRRPDKPAECRACWKSHAVPNPNGRGVVSYFTVHPKAAAA